MHRAIAITVNFMQLLFACWVTYEHGDMSTKDTLFLLLLFAVPAITLPFLHDHQGSESWMSLLLKRKRLEEKRKIEDLTAQNK